MDEGQGLPDGGLRAVFEDLEQQAAGMALAERDAELADRARGEYAAVDLASRIHASSGRWVTMALAGGLRLEGRLVAAGVDWCSVSAGQGRAWLVRLGAVATVAGCSARALPPAVRPVSAQLGLGSALHRLSEERRTLVVEMSGGGQLRGRPERIGADFVEIRAADQAETVLVPFVALSAVRAQ